LFRIENRHQEGEDTGRSGVKKGVGYVSLFVGDKKCDGILFFWEISDEFGSLGTRGEVKDNCLPKT
jgi:hypothetical protein